MLLSCNALIIYHYRYKAMAERVCRHFINYIFEICLRENNNCPNFIIHQRELQNLNLNRINERKLKHFQTKP